MHKNNYFYFKTQGFVSLLDIRAVTVNSSEVQISYTDGTFVSVLSVPDKELNALLRAHRKVTSLKLGTTNK